VPALLLTVFIDTVGFGIVLPLLPFFAENFGASPLVVTLLATVYSFSQFLFAPLWGRLSDRFGRRPIILLTLFGMFAGYVMLAAASSLAWLFIARAFTGAMAANGGVVHAYVSDITSSSDRAGGMGRLGAAHGLGFIVGPAIGGIFAGPDPLDPNLSIPFLIASFLSATAFIVAFFQVIETRVPSGGSEPTHSSRSMFRLFSASVVMPQFALLLLLLTLTPFVFSGVETTFVLWSERNFGWGPWQNGWIYAAMGAAAVVTQWFLVAPLTRAFGERRLIRVGAFLVCFGCLLLPLTSGYADLSLVFVLIVMGVSFNNPSLNSLISKYADAEERGSLLGLAMSCSALARITGPAWAGFVFQTFGSNWPFFSGAIVTGLMFLFALRLKNRR
jgi:DHA1 family tetracycline resistance protein-like MFS transporter